MADMLNAWIVPEIRGKLSCEATPVWTHQARGIRIKWLGIRLLSHSAGDLLTWRGDSSVSKIPIEDIRDQQGLDAVDLARRKFDMSRIDSVRGGQRSGFCRQAKL